MAYFVREILPQTSIFLQRYYRISLTLRNSACFQKKNWILWTIHEKEGPMHGIYKKLETNKKTKQKLFEKAERQFHKSKKGDDWRKVLLGKSFCSVLQQIVPFQQFIQETCQTQAEKISFEKFSFTFLCHNLVNTSLYLSTINRWVSKRIKLVYLQGLQNNQLWLLQQFWSLWLLWRWMYSFVNYELRK